MSERRGWKKMLGWFWEFENDVPQLPQLAERNEPEPEVLKSQHETWLEALSGDVAEGRRVKDIGSDEFWSHIDAMWKDGHERLASQWVTKFIEVDASDDGSATLQFRLADMFDRRGDLGPAIPHLEQLSGNERYATRAHYLLGEHYRRIGDEVRALRHYEAVLARDVDYPNVRQRVQRIRAARGYSGPANQGETMAGPDQGAAAGARYLLVRELGRGATAVVYLARDSELDRDVAIKLLHPHLAAAHRAGACARFFDEARICASLRHPNIVAILDIDETARRIVMELAGGGTLREVLAEGGRRTLRRALERHVQILSALNAAHRRGIVHRDLKPANLMFRRDPGLPGSEIMLGDFGVAHLPDADDHTSSGTTAASRRDAVGTLAYMSPEQRAGDKLSPVSDVYASAVVLFELLTGSLPWSKNDLLAGKRQRGDFQLPPDVIVDRDPELCTALQKHLHVIGDPDPSLRPSSKEALAEAIDLCDWAIAELI